MRIFPGPKSSIRQEPSVDGKALDNRFYTQMRVQIKNKAFAYRGTIGDYNY